MQEMAWIEMELGKSDVCRDGEQEREEWVREVIGADIIGILCT